MKSGLVGGVCVAAAFGAGMHARAAAADVTFLTQSRTVSIATSGDGRSAAASAPTFAPFAATVDLATTIPAADGPVVNAAGGRIDCQINPNAIRALGTLSGAGGALQAGIDPVLGEAKASIDVRFFITVPTPYTLYVLPRPALRATDQFELTIQNRDDHSHVVDLSQNDPPQLVDQSGILTPGEYLFKYTVEGTFDGEQNSREYQLRFLIDCHADINGVSGVDIQDIFDFLSLWFAADPRADVDGVPGLSVEDVLAFMNIWFAGC